MIYSKIKTLVSNHFRTSKVYLFSSARPREFDGMLGTGLSVSMYTTKMPIDMWHFNDSQLNIFCKRQISIKLFYLYQRLQWTNNYFFKINFVFFLYLLLWLYIHESESWKEKQSVLIYLCYQTDSVVPVFTFAITYNLPHLRLCWHGISVNTGSA